MSVKVTLKAYLKILLHCHKYPYRAINGVLIGKATQREALDCIPLFHQSLQLSPMTEVALIQIDHYCEKHDLTIMGYYQANELLESSEPDSTAFAIAKKIHDNNNKSCLLMIDNKKISPTCEENALELYMLQDDKWKHFQQRVEFVGGKAVLSQISHIFKTQAGLHHSLVDFDNHLDDISLDWLNHEVNKQIEGIKQLSQVDKFSSSPQEEVTKPETDEESDEENDEPS